MLLKTELQTWFGKKYCDEAELLPMIIAHSAVRRVRTIEVEVQPLGGDIFEMKLDDAALQATLVRKTKTEVALALCPGGKWPSRDVRQTQRRRPAAGRTLVGLVLEACVRAEPARAGSIFFLGPQKKKRFKDRKIPRRRKA
jgi:hypothetical protein